MVAKISVAHCRVCLVGNIDAEYPSVVDIMCKCKL